MSPRVAAVGILTGWGEGIAALPDDAPAAAAGRAVIPLRVSAPSGDRFRRATRECWLAVAAVEALLRDGGLTREAIRGGATALIYVTAGAYGASNRAFIESSRGALHFPYTAPSAVPAEVTIEFGLTGSYVILIGGAAVTIEALGYAGMLLDAGRAERAIVLAVETFEASYELYGRGRWLLGRPFVEAAAAALITRGGPGWAVRDGGPAASLEHVVRRRAGEMLSCAPLIALGLARAAGGEDGPIAGEWRGRRAVLAEG